MLNDKIDKKNQLEKEEKSQVNRVNPSNLQSGSWVWDNHSFEIRPGHRPGPVIGSRVRWVDPS